MPIWVKSVCPEKLNLHLNRKFSCLPKYHWGTRRVMCICRIIETCLCNSFCHINALQGCIISISRPPPRYHATSTRHIEMFGMPGRTIFFHKLHDFREKVSGHNVFSPLQLLWNISHKIHRDNTRNVVRLHVKYLSDFNKKFYSGSPVPCGQPRRSRWSLSQFYERSILQGRYIIWHYRFRWLFGLIKIGSMHRNLLYPTCFPTIYKMTTKTC